MRGIRTKALLLIAATLSLILAPSVASAQGHIQIDDGAEIDDGSRGNDVKVDGCNFQVDMYGYEDREVVRFEVGQIGRYKTEFPIYTVTPDELTPVAEIDMGAEDEVHQFDFFALMEGKPHHKHGWHVRVTTVFVDAEGAETTSQKVFFTYLCEPGDDIDDGGDDILEFEPV